MPSALLGNLPSSSKAAHGTVTLEAARTQLDGRHCPVPRERVVRRPARQNNRVDAGRYVLHSDNALLAGEATQSPVYHTPFFTLRACAPSEANPPRVVAGNSLDLRWLRQTLCHSNSHEGARHLGDESDGGRSSTAATEAPLPLVLSAGPASSCWGLALCALTLPATVRGVRSWGGADALLVLAARSGPRKPTKAPCILLVRSGVAAPNAALWKLSGTRGGRAQISRLAHSRRR